MKWYEAMIEQAKKAMQKGEQLEPVLFLKHGQHLNALPLGRFINDKDLCGKLVRFLINKTDPDEYMLLTEVFISNLKPDDDGEQALAKLLMDGILQVSQIPSSKEGVSVLLGDRKSERLGLMLFDRKGNGIKFHPIEWPDFDKLEGLFTGLR